jgi:enterochelin esterase-like enzyme
MDSTALLERARSEGSPVIDGNTAIFLWQGGSPPRLIGDFNHWSEQSVPLERAGRRLWLWSLPLPRNAYMEYAWAGDLWRWRDPFNPRTVPNGFGKLNHFFYMPEGAPTPLRLSQRGVPRGKLSRHKLWAYGLAATSFRTVHLYAPPAHQPCPLLVVLDGSDYLYRAQLTTLVENLLAQGRIRPLALAFIDHGHRARSTEYLCSEATLHLIEERLLPLARSRLNLLDESSSPGVHGMLGASAAGLMTLYAGLRKPHLFGHLLCQSGVFHSPRRGDMVVFDLVRHVPPVALRLWLCCGLYEEFLEGNRRMYALLRERGYDCAYREYPGGHNYSSWRDEVWRGLEYLYGPEGGVRAP